MLYKENVKYSKYESKIKQTTVYVQVIVSMRQTLIEYKLHYTKLYELLYRLFCYY